MKFYNIINEDIWVRFINIKNPVDKITPTISISKILYSDKPILLIDGTEFDNTHYDSVPLYDKNFENLKGIIHLDTKDIIDLELFETLVIDIFRIVTDLYIPKDDMIFKEKISIPIDTITSKDIDNFEYKLIYSIIVLYLKTFIFNGFTLNFDLEYFNKFKNLLAMAEELFNSQEGLELLEAKKVSLLSFIFKLEVKLPSVNLCHLKIFSVGNSSYNMLFNETLLELDKVYNKISYIYGSNFTKKILNIYDQVSNTIKYNSINELIEKVVNLDYNEYKEYISMIEHYINITQKDDKISSQEVYKCNILNRLFINSIKKSFEKAIKKKMDNMENKKEELIKSPTPIGLLSYTYTVNNDSDMQLDILINRIIELYNYLTPTKLFGKFNEIGELEDGVLFYFKKYNKFNRDNLLYIRDLLLNYYDNCIKVSVNSISSSSICHYYIDIFKFTNFISLVKFLLYTTGGNQYNFNLSINLLLGSLDERKDDLLDIDLMCISETRLIDFRQYNSNYTEQSNLLRCLIELYNICLEFISILNSKNNNSVLDGTTIKLISFETYCSQFDSTIVDYSKLKQLNKELLFNKDRLTMDYIMDNIYNKYDFSSTLRDIYKFAIDTVDYKNSIEEPITPITVQGRVSIRKTVGIKCLKSYNQNLFHQEFNKSTNYDIKIIDTNFGGE